MMNLKTLTLMVGMLGLMGGVAHADDMAKEGDRMKDDMAGSMSDHGMKKDDMSGDMGHGMKDKGMMKDGMHDNMKKDGMMKDDMHGSMDEDGMKESSMMKDNTMDQ